MNLHIDALCISLVGSTQPGRIANYVRAAVQGGAGDDGLIQRFGLTVFPDPSGKWKNVDRMPDSPAPRVTERVFEHLDTLDPAAVGATVDGATAVPYLRLDAGAHERFLEWRSELERRLRSGELHVAVESHVAKYRKLVPGLALIVHLAERATGPIGESAMARAVGWASYLETHEQRLYASGLHQEVDTAKAIIKKLCDGKLERTFAIKDVYRNQWAGLSDPKSVRAALQLLADYDWLAVTTISTAGPNATVYTANPRMFWWLCRSAPPCRAMKSGLPALTAPGTLGRLRRYPGVKSTGSAAPTSLPSAIPARTALSPLRRSRRCIGAPRRLTTRRAGLRSRHA